MDKYELIPCNYNSASDSAKYQIRALRDIGDKVKKGDLGGFVENKYNLSQEGDCWIDEDSCVLDDSKVQGDSFIKCSTIINNTLLIDTNVSYSNIIASFLNNSIIDTYCYIFDCICTNSLIKHSRLYSIKGNDVQINMTDIINNPMSMLHIPDCTVINVKEDYILFKNWWSSGRTFAWFRSNNLWSVGCFIGTGEELIEKAYKDSKLSGEMYRQIVEYVEKNEELINKLANENI